MNTLDLMSEVFMSESRPNVSRHFNVFYLDSGDFRFLSTKNTKGNNSKEKLELKSISEIILEIRLPQKSSIK